MVVTESEIVYLAITVSLAIVLICFILWETLKTPNCLENKCEYIQNVIYKGTDRGADVYFCLNKQENKFQTMTVHPTYSIVSSPVVDVTASDFTVMLNSVATTFTKGPTLDTATVTLNVDSPNRHVVQLRLTTIEDLGIILRTITSILSTPVPT